MTHDTHTQAASMALVRTHLHTRIAAATKCLLAVAQAVPKLKLN